MGSRFVQITAGCTPGDAITSEINFINHLLGSGESGTNFTETPVVAEHIAPELKNEIIPAADFEPHKGDVILYHYSINSSLFERLRTWPNPRFLLYHNITPAHYFLPYNLSIAGQLKTARRQMYRFAGEFQGYYGVSDFNARELLRCGCKHVKTLPYLREPRVSESREASASEDEAVFTLLFVGRLTPNKRHADLIKIFYYIQKLEPNSRLVLAGGFVRGLELYRDELDALIRALGLEERVILTGELSDDELNEWYGVAHMFLCASAHEGFGVPLLEAMEFELPVLAYFSEGSAVEETMGAAGIGFRMLDYEKIADMALLVYKDISLRDSVLSGQRRRLQELESRTKNDFMEFFKEL